MSGKHGYYDGIAEGYDELHGAEQLNKVNIIKQHIEVSKNTRILDIGCGTGISCDFECGCVGIDPSVELIKIARKKDDNPDHHYIVGKAEDLPRLKFKDKEFDYVLCVSAIHHVENLGSVFKECKRIGKECVFTVRKNSQIKARIMETLKKTYTITKEIEEDKDVILFMR